MVGSRIFKPTPLKSKRKVRTNISEILFNNNGIEFINLLRILHAQSVFAINLKKNLEHLL